MVGEYRCSEMASTNFSAGVAAASEAVRLDQGGDYESAVEHYFTAIEHLMAAVARALGTRL